MSINFNNQTDYLVETPDFNTDHLNTLPEHCPICNHLIAPVYLMEYRINLYHLNLVCGCPRKDCGKIFIVEYKSTVMSRNNYDLMEVFPKKLSCSGFS